METVTNLFQWLLDRLMDWWPIRLVDADEQGVKFTGGKKVTLLDPGWHFFWPKWERIEKVTVTYQEIDCLTQSLDTLDGYSITLSGNVGYEIRNAVKWRTEVQDFYNTVERRTRGLLAPVILSSKLEDLRAAETLSKLGETVLEDLKKHGSKWGVRFYSVSITDFTRARPIRLFNT